MFHQWNSCPKYRQAYSQLRTPWILFPIFSLLSCGHITFPAKKSSPILWINFTFYPENPCFSFLSFDKLYISWKIARMSARSLVKCKTSSPLFCTNYACFLILWKLLYSFFGCKCRNWAAIIWLWSLSLLSWGHQITSVEICHWKNNNQVCYVQSIISCNLLKGMQV